MPVLDAALVGVALVALFNLVLCVGLVRRIRILTEQVARMSPGIEDFGGRRVLAPGTAVADFAAVTTDGEPVSRALLAGPTVVAFLAPGCEPCEKVLQTFVEYAERIPGGRQQVLAVLTMSRPDECAEYVSRLAPVARVVVEDDRGSLSDAFQADAVPRIYLVDASGVIVAGGADASAFGRLSAGVRRMGALT